MTDRAPKPQGHTGRAWRTLLARCHKAENTVRELRARLAELEAQEDQ